MSTGLILSEQNYPVLVQGSAASQLIRANAAGEAIGVGDLDRIRVPAGGGTSWTIPTIEGDKSEKSIEGIIIHAARRRAYWSNPNPTGDPPDCASKDCIIGVGTPGGECGDCPLNEFGTAKRSDGGTGRGKACKETTLLFLLRPGSNLPDVVVVPPGSLKAVKQYRLKLPVPYFAAVTRLTLIRDQNKDGIGYSKIVPAYAGPLAAEAAEAVRKYAENLKGLFETVVVDREDLEG